ncbi:MAG: O-antigen ligase family protein [bacterium]|nr:O-antigen ligase family protein [bacterium]
MNKFLLKIKEVKEIKELILIIIILSALVLPAWFSGGNNFQIKEIIQALLAIAGLIFFSGARYESNRLNNKIFFVFAAWLAAMFVSSIFSVSIYRSLAYWIELLSYGLIFYAVANLKLEEHKIELMVKIFLGSAVCLSFIGLYYYITGNYARLTSTFYWPNPFAGYLLFALPPAVYFLLKERKKTVWLLALAVLVSAFILTGSRGAFISFLIAGSVYAVFFRQEVIKNRYFIMAALLISLGAVLVFSSTKPANFFDRSKLDQASSLDASTSIKLDYWQASLKIFKANFFLGTGPAAWQTVYPLYQPNPISSGKYPHNWLLEFLAENGVLAAFLFLAFIFSIFYQALKNSRGDSLKMALFAGVSGSVIHNLVDIDWHFSANFLAFWIFIGLLLNSAKNNSVLEPKRKISGSVRVFILVFLLALLAKNAVVIRANYFYGQGLSAQNQNELQAAESYYKKSLILNPNPDYLRKYGIILFALGANAAGAQAKRSYLEQAAAAEKLKKFDGHNSLNYELAGKINSAQGRSKEAEADFKEAIRLDRFNYPRFYGELAALLIGGGRSAEAKKLLQDILKSFPEKVIENRKIIIMNNQKLTSGIEADIAYWHYLLGIINASN